jgi:hypothetical protein
MSAAEHSRDRALEIAIDLDEITAPLETLAAALAPEGAAPGAASGRWSGLIEEAQRLFRSHAAPRGLLAEVTRETFADIYAGAGRNAPETPLAEIFPRAAHLALFAATIGAEVQRTLDELFASGEFPLAVLLDAAASEGADRAAAALERRYAAQCAGPEAAAFLRYSPGYCGWDITGQRALFAALAPERIGITLRQSMLMEPLKSVSGVIVGGAPEIHRFAARYPFCAGCRTHGCRERIRKVLESDAAG